MTMMRWGRGLLIWGLLTALLATAPGLILTTLLPQFNTGFAGIVGLLLVLSVAPLAALTASVGAILLLVAVVRRDPY